MFCGSATWRRWKSAPAGNSSVSVSSASPVGLASVRRLATGIERSRTASRMPRSQASVTCSSSTGGAVGCVGRSGSVDGLRAPGSRRGGGLRDVRRGRRGVRDSRSSTRCASDSRERSECGRVTFTSASSSGSRGSAPCRMSSTATARRSISRSTVGSGSWLACWRRSSFVSSVTGSDSGTWPMCWTRRRCRRCSSRSVDEPPEVLALLGELLDEEERACGVVVDDHVAEPQERLLVDRADELEHGLRVDRVVRRRRRAGRASRRRRGTSRAQRGRSARAPSPAPGSPRPSATRRRSVTTSGSRGRWKTNVWQRERTVASTCLQVRRAEDERRGGEEAPR